MVDSISYAIAYGMQYVVCIGIPHGHMSMSHSHVLCHFDLVVCPCEKGMPHGWDYFHPQQTVVHTKHFYKSCFNTSNAWQTTKYHKTNATLFMEMGGNLRDNINT